MSLAAAALPAGIDPVLRIPADALPAADYADALADALADAAAELSHLRQDGHCAAELTAAIARTAELWARIRLVATIGPCIPDAAGNNLRRLAASVTAMVGETGAAISDAALGRLITINKEIARALRQCLEPAA